MTDNTTEFFKEYAPLTCPCIVHYIGGTRYMYDTQHTFTLHHSLELLIDDETGQLYSITKQIKGMDIVEIVEF